MLPEKTSSEILTSISKYGLIPRLPCEYRKSLPELLQYTPLVWLAERMNTLDGVIYLIKADKLDSAKLYKLDWDDVDWWVYAGIIPPELLSICANAQLRNYAIDKV